MIPIINLPIYNLWLFSISEYHVVGLKMPLLLITYKPESSQEWLNEWQKNVQDTLDSVSEDLHCQDIDPFWALVSSPVNGRHYTENV